MSATARHPAARRSFWLTALVLLGLFGFADYRFSAVNQIPSDGPLTIGYPMTAYWMACPMVASRAAACASGIGLAGLIVDAIFCLALACLAAGIACRMARLDCFRCGRFWAMTSLVFVCAFLLISLLTALHAASLHGRGIAIGFPLVYLYEYAGESFSALNFIVDLVLCYAVSLLCVALPWGSSRNRNR